MRMIMVYHRACTNSFLSYKEKRLREVMGWCASPSSFVRLRPLPQSSDVARDKTSRRREREQRKKERRNKINTALLFGDVIDHSSFEQLDLSSFSSFEPVAARCTIDHGKSPPPIPKNFEHSASPSWMIIDDETPRRSEQSIITDEKIRVHLFQNRIVLHWSPDRWIYFSVSRLFDISILINFFNVGKKTTEHLLASLIHRPLRLALRENLKL